VGEKEGGGPGVGMRGARPGYMDEGDGFAVEVVGMEGRGKGSGPRLNGYGRLRRRDSLAGSSRWTASP